MEGFLQRVGVFDRVHSEWHEKRIDIEGRSIVVDAFAQKIESNELADQVESLYTYRVPKLLDGACRYIVSQIHCL